MYIYNVHSELDSPGEYFIDKQTSTLYYIPPHTETDDTNTYIISRLVSVIEVTNDVTNTTFESLEIGYLNSRLGVALEEK